MARREACVAVREGKSLSLGSYLLGVASTLIFVSSTAYVARVLRQALLRELTGALGAVATAVIWLSVMSLIGEGLGTGGQFKRWPLVAAAVLVALGAASLSAKSTEIRPTWRIKSPGVRPPTIAAALTILAIGVVIGQGLFATWRYMHTGVLYSDALQYHLTNAAFFVTSHHTNHILLDSAGAVTPYYPMNDELLHALAMSLFGRDSLSLILEFGDIALTFTVVWALFRNRGRRFCAAAVGGTSVMLVILGPGFEPNGYNDWHATSLLFASLLFVVRGRQADGFVPLRIVAIAGLAAGEAAGTKLDTLAPVFAVLIVAVVFSGLRRVVASALTFVGTALVGGGYWFVRDLVIVHNPLPELNVSIGGWRLPRPPLSALDSIDFSVLHYARNLHVIRRYFVPGLHGFLGPAWPIILAIVVLGLLGGLLFARTSTVRALALVGCVSGVAYLITPTGAAGPSGKPILFEDNIRYGLPAFVIGFWLLPTLFNSRIWHEGCAFLYVLVIASVVLQRHGWADGLRVQGLTMTALVVAAIAASWWFVVPKAFSWELLTGLAMMVVVLVVAGFPFERFYARHRYTAGAQPQQQLFAALQPATPLRVGVVGFPLEYPFLGDHWQNEVSYAGVPHGTTFVTDAGSCVEWRRVLTENEYDAVVIIPFVNLSEPRALAWTTSDPAARPLFTGTAGSIFLLNGPSSDAGC